MSDERAPWIKLYGDYTSTPSHVHLDANALWVGVVIMQLIRAGCDSRGDREPWALLPDGSPVGVGAIAHRARLYPQIVKKCLAALVAAKSFAMREDGAYGMPKFWKKQESRWAEGKRGKAMGKVTNESPGQSPVPLAKSSDSSLRSEQIPPTPSKKTASRKSAPTPVGASVADGEPTATPDPESPCRAAAKRILARLSDARLELVANARALKPTDTNLALILARLNEGEPEEDLALVVDAEADSVRRGSDSHWLNPQTPFRPGNWPTRLAGAQAWKSPRRPKIVEGGQRFDTSPEQAHREREERLAAIAREEQA